MIFPGENERRIVISVLSFCIGLGIGLVAKLSNAEPNDYLPSLATLVAAFVGAWFAFQLQKRKEHSQKTEERVDAGNRAIFALTRCHNRFLSIQRQSINDFRDNPARFVAIQPLIGEMVCDLSLDFDSLSFLFNTKKPNLLNELSAIQAEVESTVALINQRSEIHFNQVQPAAENAGFQNGEDLKMSEIEAALGFRLTEGMRSLTDQLILFVDQVVIDTEKAIKELNGLLKDEFRGHVIISMQKPHK